MKIETIIFTIVVWEIMRFCYKWSVNIQLIREGKPLKYFK